MSHRGLRLIAGIALSLLVAVPAWAQETGAISGTVTDPDGAPLPGVSVTMDSTRVPSATVFTQVNGVYRFPVLPPGSGYSLTFMLEGFKTVIQEDVPVRVGGNSQLNVTMELSTVEETVTVTGVTPIVDVKKTGTGQNITEEYMQSIPSARDPWVMMQQTAGMQVSQENIGGSASGQQSGFSGTGNRGGDAIWQYDGAEITDMSATGASPMYYDFDAFEEISITTGGNDPSIQSGGIRINFVTKRGGNQWRGASRFYLTDGSLQSLNVGDPADGSLVGNFTEEQLFPGYIGNSIENIKDWGADLGGPIINDTVFVWGAFGKQDIKQNVGTSADNTQLQNWHGKANLHLGDRAVVNYTYLDAFKTKQGRGASATRQGPTTWNQGGVCCIHTVKGQYTINDNNYVEGSYNSTALGFFLEPQGGREVQPSYDLDTGAWGRSYFFYDTKRPLKNARLDANSYMAGANIDHELKYGYSYRKADTSSIWAPAGGAVSVFNAGVPVEAWLYHEQLDNYTGTRNSFYLGDTISAGRATINVGLRYDNQSSESLASAIDAHPLNPGLFPAQSFDGFDPGHAWNTVSPRFGLTYDLTGDASTIVRLNAARYYAQQSNGEFHVSNTTFGPEMDFNWNDANSNGVIDPGETFGSPLFTSAGFDPANPNAPIDIIFDNPDAPISDELIVGFEHELSRTLGVGADFTYRKNHRENWTIRNGEDNPALWTQVSQNIAGFGTINVFEPVGPRPTQQIYTEQPNLSTEYTGVTLFLNKRFANKWMGNASFTYATPKINFGPGSFTDPTNIPTRDGQSNVETTGSAKWFLKFSGMYQLPHGISFAGFVQARQGFIEQRHIRSNNRNHGAGRVELDAASFGTFRHPNFWNLDLRAEKSFDLGDRGRLHLIADGFNITNNDIVLNTFDRLNSTSFGSITDVVQGRTIRFGARLVLR